MGARPIYANTTYLITRRTTQQQFLLRPSSQVNACIQYCLAVAQRRSGLVIHSVVFLSNHYHMVVTDPTGTLPVFTEELNKLLGRSLNCHHGRWENFWSSSEQTSHVTLADDEAVLDKTVYTLANPTAAGLVSHGGDWPGVRLFKKGTYRAKKPRFFFRTEEAGSKLPDKLELVLDAPPIGCDPKIADEIVKRAVTVQEKELRATFFKANRKFQGAQAVKAQGIYDTPRCSSPKRGISPTLACRDNSLRIEMLTTRKEFQREYKEKLIRFAAGEGDVVFPAGTYHMVRHFSARCADC